MEKIGEFRHHKIIRTCQKKYKNYKVIKKFKKISSKVVLIVMFQTEQITTPFEVDHFVPSKICEEYNRCDLITDYSNLIYSLQEV